MQAAYALFLPVFAGIDRLLARQGQAMVAIEGGSASGKTSLAALLARVYDCNVFHMDDFFLQAHQRTPERYQEPGGNVDYERFEQEVQKPLREGGAFSYRPFDCQTMAFRDWVPVTPRALNIVEGAYSLHPRLAKVYDLRVFLQIDKISQAARILKRNGPALQQRFLGEWIPLEEAYFAVTGAKARAQVVVEVGG
ncbi:MAG: phosphoribulokinase [Clostridiales bacterium]|nr:phosphoribulokinase [Clostridiales bacterium]